MSLFKIRELVLIWDKLSQMRTPNLGDLPCCESSEKNPDHPSNDGPGRNNKEYRYTTRPGSN